MKGLKITSKGVKFSADATSIEGHTHPQMLTLRRDGVKKYSPDTSQC